MIRKFRKLYEHFKSWDVASDRGTMLITSFLKSAIHNRQFWWKMNDVLFLLHGLRNAIYYNFNKLLLRKKLLQKWDN